MQRFKFLILFFGLPAPVTLPGFCCVTPLCRTNSIQKKTAASRRWWYARFVMQLKLSSRQLPVKYLAALLLICLTTGQTNAQTDSNTVIISTNESDEPDDYDDQDDGYVDTTVKHIYDTSQYFFNWKTYDDDSYSDKKITPRQLIDEEVNALKQQDDFWYIPAIEKLETRLKNDPKFRDSLLNLKKHELADQRQNGLIYQSWFNMLLWIIIIGIFTAAVIYFLIQNKINLFSKNAASSQEEENDDAREDIFRLSYSKLILNAEKEKDFRVAIRLMFLQTLKLLSDTNAIHYQPDYTNLHYLQQLQQSKFYNEFFTVMRNYEYAWYGKFNISSERYTAIKNDFLKLQHKIT